MRTFILSITFLQFFSCTPTVTKDETSSPERVELADSLFSLKDIQRTDNINLWELECHTLDSANKMRFFAPILYASSFSYPVDKGYFLSSQQACFVAKQAKIGEYTPILISLTGDDTEFLFYILLDKDLNPSDGVHVGGLGLCGGPDEVGDSLRLCTVTKSFIDRTEIITSHITEIMRPDSVKHPSHFDSVSIKYSVSTTGDIRVASKDSVRFSRLTN